MLLRLITPPKRVRLMLTLAALAAGAREVSAASDPAVPKRFLIQEYRVVGARSLPRLDVEEAVYPFLGPDRTERDIERARAALEKAFADAGYQTVGVNLPAQDISGGIVELRVVERPVGRLRVKGARYSSPRKIKEQAPSVAEGRVINFKDIPRDLAALNQLPNRRVMPSLQAGAEPDTVDVNLEVQEERPVHASVELNNRSGPSTEPLRLNASIGANNLAQSGHSLGFSYQTAPQKPEQVQVYSGYYLARFRHPDWLNLLVQATRQDSNVSTLGDAAVTGRGTTAGLRLLCNLPAIEDYTQSASFGVDYRRFDQTIALAADGTSPATTIVTPVTSFPLAASYNGTWRNKENQATTEIELAATFHLRGLGSNLAEFGLNRYNASGNFIFFHGELAHTRAIGAGFQLHGRVHGQVSDQPLLGSSGDQIAGGGVDSVRGYHEAEVTGDSGVFGTLELRSPSLLKQLAGQKTEWRLVAFADAGWLKVIDPLPGQKNHFDLASLGLGSQLQLGDRFNATVFATQPQLKQGETAANEYRVIFQGSLTY